MNEADAVRPRRAHTAESTDQQWPHRRVRCRQQRRAADLGRFPEGGPKLRPEGNGAGHQERRWQRVFSAAGKAPESRTCAAGKYRQFETWDTRYKVRAGERQG